MNPITVLPTILPFDAPGIGLENAGGKGANLARLACAGYPVPAGFLVTTAAYAAFVTANQLEARIQAVLAAGQLDELAGLERAADEIRALFAAGALPAGLADRICQEYAAIGSPPVAVRSSATAEDLPDLSFAGQQDTYLNVTGAPALLTAVVDCWASLWTGRAIGYRARQCIAQTGLSLAVVVQQMVQSEVSGVLFTANPLTGLRSETVIDATFGLGEALVSGQVEPDHYVVDAGRGLIVQKTLGAKALAIRSKSEGGVAAAPEDAAGLQALPDAQILELARLGQRVAAEYAFPQDIEFAWAGGCLFLLQSRPITSLFPIPAGLAAEPLDVLFSFGAVQGMLDPVTPLGLDLFRIVFAAGSTLFGYSPAPESQTVLYEAGERGWVKITAMMRNTTGRKVMRVALSLVEPSVGQALELIWDDPRLLPVHKGLSWSARRRLARSMPRLAGNVLLNLLAPERRRAMIVDQGEQTLAEMRTCFASVTGDRWSKLLQRAEMFPNMIKLHLPPMFLLFVSGVAAGMAPFNLVNQLASQLPRAAGAEPRPGWNDLALEVSRGLPHNPTTEMDLMLWDTARAIRSDPASVRIFLEAPASELAEQYLAGTLPAPAQGAVQRFMDRYGERGLAEIDLGRPRWREDPTHVMQVLGSYLQIEDEALAPDVVFQRGAQRAAQAIDELVAGLRKTPNGWFKAHLARLAAGRVRALLGVREAPKFFAVRMFGVVRLALLESGQEFFQAGELDRPDDLLYLTHIELRAFTRGELPDYRALIAARRANYTRELRRRQIPKLLLSDGRAFYEGMNGDGAAGGLNGAPVSPGVVEGSVRVILDPRGAQLLPGEIMVCPGTDPSWTPLFLAAGGLVMEVGGMMTHGAVVAREYGIPAVVGVHDATTRLQTGQRIRLDGSSGKINLI